MKYLLPLTLAFPFTDAGSCSCTDDVVSALSHLYVATAGANWDDKANWMDFSTDPCDGDWDGLTANSDKVVKMNLENNDLVGTIPTQVGLLTDLTDIKLGKNTLTGTIPTEFGMLTNVKKFKIQLCSLTGAIPSELGMMTAVGAGNRDFNLESNMLCGDIPEEVSALSGGSKYSVSDGNGLGTACEGTDDGNAGDDATDDSTGSSSGSGDDNTGSSSGSGDDNTGSSSGSGDDNTGSSSGSGDDNTGSSSEDSSSGSGDDSSSCIDSYGSCATYVEAGKCSVYFCPTCSYSGYCDSSCDYCDDGSGDDASSSAHAGDDSTSGTDTSTSGSGDDGAGDDATGDDSTGTNGGGSRTCFSGDDKVTLESGEMKPFRFVEVGDSILSANRDGVTSYSNVIFLPHGENDKRANFIVINTESGREIKMTRGHLLPLCSGALSPASEIEVGSCLRTIDGEDAVLNLTAIELNGVYTAVTENEFLVVNGIIASPFASGSGLVHAFYNTTDMEDWCESNDWLAFENAKHPHVKQMVKPSDDCLTMLNGMFENYKDEPIGWGANGFGYRNNWKNPATPEVHEKTEKSIPFILSGW